MTGVVEVLDSAGGGRLMARRILGFVRVLRDNGFAVGLREAIDALRVAEMADLGQNHALRWAFRSLLCT